MRGTLVSLVFSSSLILMLVISLSVGCKKEKDKDDDNNKGIKLETGTVKDIEGNTYKTVKIGNQWWMAENLNTTKMSDGTDIPFHEAQTWASLKTPGYSWYNFQTYGDTYGAQYNWYAVETGKLCPAGWHVPSDEEWQVMEMHLGLSSGEAQSTGFRGIQGEGGKLKDTGTEHWDSPNTGATNETGFTGLPGGVRTSGVMSLGRYGHWWTSTPETVGPHLYGWNRALHYGESRIYRGNNPASYGYSVRCIKN